MAANILLVEDEPAIQELIAFNLTQAGHNVLRASTAEAAVTLVKNALPDLVLLDWMLPGASGLDVARRLRADERTRQIPIIMNANSRVLLPVVLAWGQQKEPALPILGTTLLLRHCGATGQPHQNNAPLHQYCAARFHLHHVRRYGAPACLTDRRIVECCRDRPVGCRVAGQT